MSAHSQSLVIRDEGHYLATCAEVRALTQRIESVSEAKELSAKASAAKVWAERAHLGEEQVNLAAIAKLWAERRAGELLTLSRESGERATSGVHVSQEFPRGTLADIGVTAKESHRFQKLAAVPADDFEQALDDQAASGPVTTAGTLRRLDIHFSSATDGMKPKTVLNANAAKRRIWAGLVNMNGYSTALGDLDLSRPLSIASHEDVVAWYRLASDAIRGLSSFQRALREADWIVAGEVDSPRALTLEEAEECLAGDEDDGDEDDGDSIVEDA